MKVIHLAHKVCGMTCMVNGLEDLYEWKTGVRLPDRLLFYLSGMAGFAYLKFKQSPIPRFVGWGTVPKRQYAALESVIGFQWRVLENRSFKYSLKRARDYIDRGIPVILGAVDMYHLPYYEHLYHTHHIPIHYVLLVGYDDERELVLLHDCDQAGIQELSYEELQLAWNVDVPGMSKKNTLFAFDFGDEIADVTTIVYQGLHQKASAMLGAPVSMVGIKGIRKLARELPHWPEELDAEQLEACLRTLVEYTGDPPALPSRLSGQSGPGHHAGGRDGFAALLAQLAEDYGWPAWAAAAALFEQSGRLLEQLTDSVVDYILGERESLEPAGAYVGQIAELEERAYRLIAESIA